MFRITGTIVLTALSALSSAIAQDRAPDSRKRPLALVREAGTEARIRRAGFKSSLGIVAGELLFEGDTVLPNGKPVKVLSCSARAAPPEPGSLSLFAETTSISAAALAAASVSGSRESACLLPLIDQSPRGTTDPSSIADPSLNADPLIEMLPPPTDLAAQITRAAMFQSRELYPQAIRELRAIESRYPDALWVRPAMEDSAARHVVSSSGGGSSVKPARKTYALLVGVSEYQNPAVSWLNYAHDDAQLVGRFLQSQRAGGLRPCAPESRGVPGEDCEIRTLTNRQATSSAVRAALDDLLKSRGDGQDRQTSIIVFVAAHGFLPCVAKLKSGDASDATPAALDCSGEERDRETVVLTNDSNPEAPDVLAIPFMHLADTLKRNAGRYRQVLLLLDVCHSGVTPWLADRIVPPVAPLVAKTTSPRTPLGILAASSRKQEERHREFAYENAEIKHGVFTYYFVAGMAGAVAPDAENRIEFEDIKEYVAQQVRAATGKLQTPSGSAESSLILIDNTLVKDFPFEPRPPGELVSRIDRKPKPRSFEAAPALTSAEEAIAHIRRQSSPGDPASLKRLEVALEDAGNQVIYKYLQGDRVAPTKEPFRQCAAYFAEAFKLAPGFWLHESRRLFCEARARLFDADGFEPALELLERAIRLDPGRSYTYNALGLSHLERITTGGNPQAAISAFSDAIRLAPHWAYARHNLALTYAVTGEYDNAIRTYQEAMQARPDYSYLPFNLGLLYQKLNLRDEAKHEFSKALKLAEAERSRMVAPPRAATDSAAIETALGTLETRQSRALARYEAALKLDPAYLPATHNKALAFAEKGRWAEAVKLWGEVLTQDQNFVAARIALAETLAAKGEPNHAIAAYRELIACEPGYIAAYRELAELQSSVRDFDGARATLKSALALTRNPSTLTLLSAELSSIGNTARPRR